MATEQDALPLPAFVEWSGFPFEGDLRVRPYKQPYPGDRPRTGEPGGAACPACAADDSEFIWVDELWRVSSSERVALPVQVMLTCRDHCDQHELEGELAATLGQMIVRLDRALQAVPGVGRVHTARYGDGGSHFHMFFSARPRGSSQMLGWALPMWSLILPPTPDDVWNANLLIVAAELAERGGQIPSPT